MTPTEKIKNSDIETLLSGAFGGTTGINILSTHYYSNSVNGKIIRNGETLFYKISNIKNSTDEANGYRLLKRLAYPLPKLLMKHNDSSLGILLYEYEQGFDQSGFSLGDYIQDAQPDSLHPGLISAFSVIREGMLLTLESRSGHSPLDAITRQRFMVGGQFWKFYGSNLERLPLKVSATVIANGSQTYRPLSSFLSDLIEWSQEYEHDVHVACHGDFSEHNVGLKPVFVDLAHAGINPLVGDLAIAFWNIYAAGGYLTPIHAPHGYSRRPEYRRRDSQLMIDTEEHTENRERTVLRFEISPVRRLVLEYWHNHLFIPMIEAASVAFPGWEWRTNFARFLATRILALYDCNQMSLDDRSFVLASLAELSMWCDFPNARSSYDLPLIDSVWEIYS